MGAEFGQFTLVFALFSALLTTGLCFFSRKATSSTVKRCARLFCFAILISYVCLTLAFLHNDFSVMYVANNSNTHLPWFYRLVAVWGAHEGSMLLWVTTLALWILAVCRYSTSLPEDFLKTILGSLSAITAGFLCFILFTSNPFLRTLPFVPLNGHDLNPLLQDPGLIIHPPMLYMGYVGFSVAFSFAIAALLGKRLDTDWARWTRRWTLAAWCFLTAGIMLGSWWSYHELGWGGWWFWDPVENASFMPWLVGTALIHSLRVTEKSGAFKGWTALLAILSFSLSLLGTFLVRSGVLTSVHAFAVDPRRGAFMLGFLVLVIGASLGLYATRAHTLKQEGNFQPASRETFLLLNNILLTVIMFTVLLGTLYPLIIDALALGKISVGPPYYNTVFLPLASILFICMGIGPVTRWRAMPAKTLARTLVLALLGSVTITAAIAWMLRPNATWQIILGLALAAWVLSACLKALWDRKRHWSFPFAGMLVAHIGIAVCIIGITFASVQPLERDVTINAGETVTLGGYQLKLLGTREIKGSNYDGYAADFLLKHGQHFVNVISAEKRRYHPSETVMTKAGIDAGITRDVYIALGQPNDHNGWSARFYIKPFVRWIWGGGDLMVLGGVLAMLRRKRRR